MIKRLLNKLKIRSSIVRVELPKTEEENIILVKNADISKARKEAQKDISYFIENLNKFVNSPDWFFSVKKHFIKHKQHEHMWVAVNSYKKGIFYGTLGNEPFVIKSMKLGDKIKVTKMEVDDWMFFDPRINAYVGGYSVKKLGNLK